MLLPCFNRKMRSVIYRRGRVPCQMCRITITVFIEDRKKISFLIVPHLLFVYETKQ